jgi:ankyrin repeat protein
VRLELTDGEVKMKNLLHSLASNDSTQVAEFIISNVEEIDAVDNEGNTALNIAVQNRNIAVAALLLQKGANPYARNTEGMSPSAYIKNAPTLIELVKFVS